LEYQRTFNDVRFPSLYSDGGKRRTQDDLDLIIEVNGGLDIYDEPPFDGFWILDMIGIRPIDMDKGLDAPMEYIYAVADKELKVRNNGKTRSGTNP
jgi:hypothetical protein